ncbi:MAG TPA: macrolide family glycosyltransferase [Pseudonocardiaceae bacterium]|nr:macrolide family glycosyltransferase [Pseudonocardiaceae bacterium]
MHLVMAGVTAPSHVYPSLALISELVSRGHRVSYAVGEQLAELVAPTGAEVVSYTSALPDADVEWPDDIGAAMQLFLDEATSMLDPLLDRIKDPDAVLYDIGGFAGRVAAHRWGVPAVQLSPTYVAWEGYEQDTAEQNLAVKESPSGRRFYENLRSWLAANEMQLDADAFLGRPDACVVLIPRVLQPHADRVGPRYVFAGPCIDPARTTGWVPEPDDDRPLVYVSFGTAYTDQLHIYRLCVEQLAQTYRLVLSTGKVDPADLGPLPAGVQAARIQPQLDVLAHASVFITHAGMGGSVESLWFGVPTVAIPQAVDQFANAARLETLGVGVHLPAEQVDGESLRSAVAVAAARTERARELRQEVRSFGGIEVAADTVERLCAPDALR